MPRESSIAEGTRALTHSGKISSRESGGSGTQPYLYGRVVSVVLSEKDPLFTKYNALEAIEFEPIHDITTVNESGDKQKNYLVAYKFNTSVRTPLINEIVPLFNAPDIQVQLTNNQFSEVFYYAHPIAMYAAVEHNAAPDDNTLQNINNPNSSQNKIQSYQSSTTGIMTKSSNSDTILSRSVVKLGDYFIERGIKPLSPMEGDYKLEGRFGNSIRFGGTPSAKISTDLPWRGSNIGSPITIIRNNQRNIDPKANISAISEDINLDGSSVYMLSDQTVDLVLGSDNFDSYNQSNDNSIVKSSIVVSTPSRQSVTSSAFQSDDVLPVETIPMPVTSSALQGASTNAHKDDLAFIPDNEDDLNFVQVGDDIPVPLTQGTILNKFNSNYKFTDGTNEASVIHPNIKKARIISLSATTAISAYAGGVNGVPSISKNGKALLDLISLTEGTMGQGSFNGYDIIVGGGLIPGFDNINSAPPHPNIKVKTEYPDPSTAAGRYQFVIKTWNLVAGNGTTMSRFNQDYTCWKNILNSANIPTLLINKIDTDQNSFSQVINLLASQWSSLPTIKDPKGLYKQAGRFTLDILYTYFKLILTKYR